MKKNLMTIGLALLAAGSSFAQPKPEADPKLLHEVRLMAQSSYAHAKNLTNLADKNGKPLLCVIAEGPVLVAETFATVIVASAKGIMAATQASSGAEPLPPPVNLINKSDPQKAQKELSPIVAKINASHKDGEPITLEQIKKNLNLLKAEKDKVLATDLDGSFKNSVKDHMTCRSLSRKKTAKLAEIAVTEFDYLSTVYRALNGGFTPRLSAFPYDRNQTYEDILADLHFMNYIYLDPPALDVRQSNRATSSTRSQEGSSKQASDDSSAKANRAD